MNAHTLRARAVRAAVATVVSMALLASCTGGPGRGAARSPAPGPSASASAKPPREPEQRYGFVFVGDFGTGDDAERAVASRVRTWTRFHQFDAFVTLGDNVYPSGSASRFEEAWTRPYGWVRRVPVPVLASLGNHDVGTADGSAVMSLLGMPDRWYHRRIGPVDFFVLDSTKLDQSEQLEWFAKALAAAKAPWQIVVFHSPVLSCGLHGSTPGLRDRLAPIMRGKGVDLVVNGHDHDYQRFAPQSGVTYVVAGGGGASLYRVGDCPAGTPRPVAYDDTTHHFLHVAATSRRLTVTVVGVERGVLDSFELQQ